MIPMWLAGRAACWEHLDPVLMQGADGAPTAIKLRCKHCSNLFSALNPSRTVADHLKACKKYHGEVAAKVRHCMTGHPSPRNFPICDPASFSCSSQSHRQIDQA